MYTKTAAIVLRTTKYSDTTDIVHLYTERFGRSNYLLKGAHSRKSANKAALFSPLSVIEAEISVSPNRDLQRICESHLLVPQKNIPFDFAKQTIVLFLAEILYRTLKQPIENPELFRFLKESVQLLDTTEAAANFHPLFLMQLAGLIGFAPNLDGKGAFFDMESGEMCYQRPLHPHFLEGDELEIFRQASRTAYADLPLWHISRNQRSGLLDNIIQYYKLHVPEFYGVQSLEVFKLFD